MIVKDIEQSKKYNKLDKNLNSNMYYKIDNYKLGDIFYLQYHNWTIKQISGDLRKIYHCVNEIDLRGSFDAIQLKEAKLLN